MRRLLPLGMFAVIVLAGASFAKADTVSIADLTGATPTPVATDTPAPTAAVATNTPIPTVAPTQLADTGFDMSSLLAVTSLAMVLLAAAQLRRRAA